MSKRRYETHLEVFAIPDISTELPVEQPIAVYYRQSTASQLGNISTEIQTVDMVEYLKRKGWAEENIILIDMDKGVSGSKKIDERAGMSLLFELITDRKIGAVACQDEDRLFRDVTQIQVNIFIEACKASGVLVLTPSMVYDFSNAYSGTFHARQFRFKSEMAAEYIESFVKGRLHRAKRRLALEGRWTGGSIPPGFMVDMRKTLPDGDQNENWRRYALFEPYAEVINEYFLLFLALGGSISRTLREIHQQGYSYPDPATCQPPEGYKVYYGIRRHGNGFYPAKTALSYILTNVAYIGHWTVNNTIVRWDNHPAIVPTETFMQAFNYLSEYGLDGESNQNYRPFKTFARPSIETERPVERPLCAGMLVSLRDGKWHHVGTEYVKREENYKFILYTRDEGDILEEYRWSKKADAIDDAVCKFLREKLRATFDSEVWAKTLEAFEQTLMRERKLKQAQLTSLERSMQNMIDSIATLTSPQMIKAVEERYEDTRKEHQRLSNAILAMDNEEQNLQAVFALRNTYEPALDSWEQMPHSERRVLLHAFIDRIEVQPVENHGIELTICWRDESRDVVTLARQATHGTKWTFDEADELLSLVDAGASQVEIAATFPDRVWRVIGDKINNLRDRKTATFTPKPIRDFESYSDYQARLKKSGGLEATRHRWRKEELVLLLDMLDNGATKMEIAQAFPYRKWTRLRAKISELRGKDFDVPGDKPIRSEETFEMYEERIGNEECTEFHDTNMTGSRPSIDDRLWFEFLVLEGTQAGLSWITILRKREHYRAAFDNFQPEIVANYGDDKVQELLSNPGIIRNKLKVRSAIQNAQAFLKVQESAGSFDAYIWQFVDGQIIQNSWKTLQDIPAITPESEAMSKDLKQRGFNFVGPTICYALMQATGMVNDHAVGCFRHGELS